MNSQGRKGQAEPVSYDNILKFILIMLWNGGDLNIKSKNVGKN